MPLKGVFESDHVPVNKFKFVVDGLPPIVFTKVTGLEEEVPSVDLPDKTTATGGRSNPGEIELSQPMHHKKEVLAMEGWYAEGKDPVSLFYKKDGVLTYYSQSGISQKSWLVAGGHLTKRSLPDAELDNDGDMAEIGWTCKVDEIFPVMI